MHRIRIIVRVAVPASDGAAPTFSDANPGEFPRKPPGPCRRSSNGLDTLTYRKHPGRSNSARPTSFHRHHRGVLGRDLLARSHAEQAVHDDALTRLHTGLHHSQPVDAATARDRPILDRAVWFENEDELPILIRADRLILHERRVLPRSTRETHAGEQTGREGTIGICSTARTRIVPAVRSTLLSTKSSFATCGKLVSLDCPSSTDRDFAS